MKLLLTLGRCWPALAILALAACSKTNNVDASKNVITGVACTGDGDPACGNGGACVLGYCRIPCDTDQDCPQGSLCIGSGPFGCQLTWDAFCNSSQPCKTGLTCASDHTCRMPCPNGAACPRSDQVCKNEVCVGTDEAVADANAAD